LDVVKAGKRWYLGKSDFVMCIAKLWRAIIFIKQNGSGISWQRLVNVGI
jgi:hypothetical protein